MAGPSTKVVSFVLVADRLRKLPELLRRCFSDPWVASYQIGFGPPLVRSSDKIRERLKEVKSALEKLDAYLEVCILNPDEQRRLALLFRRLTVRRQGPLEAEALDNASAQVLDLVIRLHIPAAAPKQVQASMEAEGVKPVPTDTPPDAMSGRFFVPLGNPRNERLLHHDAVARVASDPDTALALEMRVPVENAQIWRRWFAKLVRAGGFDFVELEPMSHARTSRDGARS